MHETAAGGTVLHELCPSLMSAADYALSVVERRPESTVEVVRVGAGERKTVLTFAGGSRRAEEATEPQSLLDVFGYPVTSWRAAPPHGRRS